MPLRLITWNIHVSFSASQTPKRDEKDWVDICFFPPSNEWHIYSRNTSPSFQDSNFIFLLIIVASWNWSYLGTKERFLKKRCSFLQGKLPHLKLPVALDVFFHVGSQAQSHKDIFRQNPTARPCGSREMLRLPCNFFFGPNLVWSLDYTTRPSQRGRAQPWHLAPLVELPELPFFFWALRYSNTVFGWDMQRLVPSPLKK